MTGKPPRPTFVPHPGVDPRCALCRGESFVLGRAGERAVASVCGCVGRCPECRGTGFVARGEAFRAPRARCRCSVVGQRVHRFNEAGIPARHATCTIGTFDPSDKKVTPTYMAIRRYLSEYSPGQDNRGLVLHGPVGGGKTHLMVAIVRELVFTWGVTVRFVEFSHLIAALKSSFDHGGGSSSLLDPLARVDVLAIDELGKGLGTEWEQTVVDELISRRYNANGTILATTNYGPGAASGDKTRNLTTAEREPPIMLADRVGPRVYSRLFEMCDFYPLLGHDYRLRRKTRRPS